MALDLTALKAELQRNRDADSAMGTLLAAYFAAVESAKGDPAAVQAVVDEFRADVDAQIAATLANTAADPNAPPAGSTARR